MIWNKELLSVVDMYEMKAIGFSHTYLNFISKMKENNVNSVLDLCCGYGQYSLNLDENGFKVTALDIDANKTDHLLECCNKFNRNIKILNADMLKLPFNDNTFDSIICLSSLHHLSMNNILKSFNEIYRVLTPGGMILFDFISTEDATFWLGNQIEPNTFVGSREGEENVPHHYTTVKELKDFLKNFSNYVIKATENILNYNNQISISRFFEVIATK